MDKITLAVIAAILAPSAAGAAYLAHLLRRDRASLWHPGDPLPHVPPDAPIRHWNTPKEARRKKVYQ